MGEKLTKRQRYILERLADGESISYSQDGEVGWLWPSDIRLEEVGISDRELQDLRDRKLMAMRQDDDDEGVWFSPPDVITPAGREALRTLTEGQPHAVVRGSLADLHASGAPSIFTDPRD